jgi:metallo-beta-lactamase family protein
VSGKPDPDPQTANPTAVAGVWRGTVAPGTGTIGGRQRVLKITFHGAAREVTGSCHLVETPRGRVLLDCGMIQGGPERHERNRERFPFDPTELTAVILSHAHIDHTGRLPLILKAGYEGPVFATETTVELCRIMLPDSGRIQEEDALWKIKRLEKEGHDASWVTPLYTEEDALEAVDRIQPLDFHREYALDGVGALTFHLAGHILGAAVVELTVRGGERAPESRRILFSGDLGVEGARLLGPPETIDRPDYLLMESTYGDRQRVETMDRTEELLQVVEETAERGGKVIIPSFAVGRTQEVLARLNDLVESGRLTGMPVYVDSPMATAVTRVFALHPEVFSDEARELLRTGDEPLVFPGLRLITSVRDSMELNDLQGPAIIISASGMCTAGRIKHHLKHNISDRRNTILFVGYQAEHTLGRHIQSGTNPVRIFGGWFDVNAEIRTIEGFSAHADLDELIGWYDALGGVRRQTFLVHGEEAACLSLAERLRERGSEPVTVPEPHQEFLLK